jgi:TP901 family phage tail tape measure protein
MSMMKFAGPLALMGGAAMKSAMDFDKSMTKIKTLVGVAGDQVDIMGVKVKEMSRETAVSSREAADALFFITSAGLRGQLAIDTLNASMKAAALGLGETKSVADAATSALNAYKGGNLSATGAVDVLTAAVREGKLEADELAGSIGKVTPIASNMGVEFHEVGAALAAMSRTGTNAAIGATQLKGILKSLLDPTSEAKDELRRLGTSSKDLQTMLGEQGLLHTLKYLNETFKENGDAQQIVFGNSRALMGVMDLMGKNTAETEAIFARMAETAGITDEAFKELEKSSEFQLRKAMNNLKTSFTEFGNTVMLVVGPALSKIMGVMSGLFGAFRKLNPGIQQAVLIFASFAVVLPIITMLVGGLASAFAFLMSPIVLVIGAIVGIAAAIYKFWPQIKTAILAVTNYFIGLYNENMALRLAVEYVKFAFKNAFAFIKMQVLSVINAFKTFGTFIYNLFSGVGKIIKAAFSFDLDTLKSAVREVGNTIAKDLSAGFKNQGDIYEQFGEEVADNFNTGVRNVLQTDGPTAFADDSMFTGLEGWFADKGAKMSEFFTSGFGDAPGLDAGGILGGLDSGGGDGGTGGTGGTGGGSGDGGVGSINKTKEALEKLGMTSQHAKDSINDSMSQISSSIVDSMGLAGTALGNYINDLLNMVTEHLTANMTILMSDEQKALKKQEQVGTEIALDQTLATVKTTGAATQIAANTATSASDTATAVKSMSASGGEAMADAVPIATKGAKAFGPAAPFILPILIAGVVTLITKALKKAKKFKKGGIVSGTTLGMVGEYAGARSNPEVIAPLDKLKGMLPQPQAQPMAMGGNFTVDGQDLVLALGRANANNERL